MVPSKKKQLKKKTKKKMAERICVSVLESPYSMLTEFGVPLPVCLCMQNKGLQLDKALWTARQSNGGFSISYLLLESKSAQDITTVAKKRRKRRRQKKKAQAKNAQAKNEVVETQHPRDSKINQRDPTLSTPIVAHQCSRESSTSAEEVNEPVDLTTCETVTYEERNEVPGVKYSLDGNEAWTPVIRRKRRRRCSSTDDSSSSSELDVSCSRMVEYEEHKGAPGLSIHRRNVRWTPIEPSPVAFRTRSRTKDTYSYNCVPRSLWLLYYSRPSALAVK